MDKNEKAIDYITRVVKSLVSTAVIEFVNENINTACFVEIKGKRIKMSFGYDVMCDLESALPFYQKNDNRIAMTNEAKYKIYIQLGKEGMIPNFQVSHELLSEKREWITNCQIDISKYKSLYKIFLKGLKKLRQFLNKIIINHDIQSSEMNDEMALIVNLIRHYQKNETFLEREVSAYTLGYFKAAIICEIIEREKEKEGVVIPRVLKSIDKKIYSLVEELRNNPFPQIKMPECIDDYVKDSKMDGADDVNWMIQDEEFKCKKEKNQKTYKCFVIMPIGEDGSVERRKNEEVYTKIIKSCVENSGYSIKCYHSDLIGKPGSIPEQIIEALHDDDIVIADLRMQNPNVIWELGVRHAFLKRSIMICSNINQTFFDTSTYRVARYHTDGTSNQPFFNKLKGFIDHVISDPREPDNPIMHYQKMRDVMKAEGPKQKNTEYEEATIERRPPTIWKKRPKH